MHVYWCFSASSSYVCEGIRMGWYPNQGVLLVSKGLMLSESVLISNEVREPNMC